MQADLVLFNGIIYTMAQPARASALAVSGGRILAAGDDAAMRALAGPGARLIDLQGRCVVPGMIDAHLHLCWYGLSLGRVQLDGAASLEECLARVRAFPRERGAWMQGSGWNHNAWSNPVFPDRHALDSVAPDNPVVLTRKDGHSIWVNSLALKLAGVTSATPDPAGGAIDREPHSGEPTGILRENAMDLVYDVIPAAGPAEIERALLRAQASALANGLTGVHTMEGAPVFAALQRLDEAGKLTLRVCQSIPKDNLDMAIGLGLRSGYGNRRLRLGGVKLFADGSLGSATAAMLGDYEGMPGVRGVVTLPKDELRALVRKAVAAGIAPTVHAIGDAANRDVLDVYEECIAELAGTIPALPFRIEHVQVLHPADIGRFARLGIVASMQPTHCPSDRDTATRLWGARSRYAYAWRSLLQSGAALAFGSDCPVETLSPLAGIHAAVTRQRIDEPHVPSWYPEECLTVEQALRGYTLGAAAASGEAHVKGSLEAGKAADMVMLSADIMRVQPQEIPYIAVEMTFIGGREVFTRQP